MSIISNLIDILETHGKLLFDTDTQFPYMIITRTTDAFKQITLPDVILPANFLSYVSNGCFMVEVQTVVTYAKLLRILTPDPIISVGSGNGCIEKLIDQTIGTNIICIDPYPNTFNPAPDHLKKDPAYPNVDECIKSNMQIVGNCSLMINWAQPELDYDFEAITKLNPMYILWIGELRGASSGIKFRDWLLGQTTYKIRDKYIRPTYMSVLGLDNKWLLYAIMLMEKIQ